MRSLVFLLLVALASAKVYERCEWARVLKAHGMDGYYGNSLADWVCLSKWESSWTTTSTTITPTDPRTTASFRSTAAGGVRTA
ncbi:hypothetical protein KUCAC02_026558 [Chaenocephalus aceratus]|nr:hypothetical protein KUCAC02_026558 [Chaenocephalus aceratus]